MKIAFFIFLAQVLSLETFMTHEDTHEHENTKYFHTKESVR